MSKVKLEVGTPVSCIVNGKGEIFRLSPEMTYAIYAGFDTGREVSFTVDGKEVEQDANPTLKLLNIPFTEGLEVECDIFGSGTVCNAKGNGSHPIGVFFNSGVLEVYTADGRINKDANQTLFPKYEI